MKSIENEMMLKIGMKSTAKLKMKAWVVTKVKMKIFEMKQRMKHLVLFTLSWYCNGSVTAKYWSAPINTWDKMESPADAVNATSVAMVSKSVLWRESKKMSGKIAMQEMRFDITKLSKNLKNINTFLENWHRIYI